MPGSDVPALDERNENAGAKDPGKLVVYVTGAVVQPGLVSLAQGSRIGDAVSAAGGMRDDAAPAAVNLAELVDDGIHVHIPTQGEVPATQGADTPLLSGGTSGQTGAGVPLGASSAKGSSSSASGSTSGKVNINTADATTLQTLDGVGPATAQKIIDYRNAQGPFRSKDDLKNVSGIGEKKFAALVDRIAV
jgi:competence protein ComEA